MRISRRKLFLGAAAGPAAAGRMAAAAPPESSAVGRRFTGESLREIAFPLGGIGTGTVSLGGCGDLRDWEIFNRPNKNTAMPFTFAALRLAGSGLKQPLARVAEREMLPPYRDSHGIGREKVAGLPRFREVVFVGAYPFANLYFQDVKWPVELSLAAFNPMIPLDTRRSSLPVAILTYRVRSRAAFPLDASLAFSMMNPVGYDGLNKMSTRRGLCFGGNVNEFRKQDGATGIFFSSRKQERGSFRDGTLALATDAADISYRLRWQHGAAWDELQMWWAEFLGAGRFPNSDATPSEEGFTEYATLAAHLHLQPGQSQDVSFVIAWHYPNVQDYWSSTKNYFFEQRQNPARLLRNQYGADWPSAWEPAAYTLANLTALREETARYRDTLYSSTVPPEVIDAVSSQASVLRTNTLMVMKGNIALGFEGCGDEQGCCPMNCTHVYNYEQALAHLYPELERNMRETDFLNNLRADGYMSFRTATPLQQGAYTRHPAADGQMGAILRLYREWLRSGDDAWLRKLWPSVKKALEFAWTQWDADRDGVMEGEQHNTYDVRFYGPNSMVGTLYLGALAAAAKMARHLGDNAAEEYERMFRGGAEKLDRLLWNGEYYVQKADESHKGAATWQFGEGCLSDQLLGQWFAEIVGLGKLLPRAHILDCLRAIFRYNFRENFHDFPSAQRIYALNDEQGLVVCSWPRGKRPSVPFGYCDEVWTGVEYQVAAHLVYEGFTGEAAGIVKAVRDRHDGRRRNPWDEVECGHHYARAMSSWSLLTAYSGFLFSAPEKTIGFDPRVSRSDFRCLFSAGAGWGEYAQVIRNGHMEVKLKVHGGALEIAFLRIPALGKAARVKAAQPASVRVEDGTAVIAFTRAVRLRPGDELALTQSLSEP